MPVSNNELIRFTLNDGVARITLNRPKKRNALSRELIAQLSQAVEEIAADDSVRLLVLCSTGSVFCAGMDLEEMQDRAGEPNAIELWQQDTQSYHDLLVKLFTLTLPTLAVVQGPALAGDLDLFWPVIWFLLPRTLSFLCRNRNEESPRRLSLRC